MCKQLEVKKINQKVLKKKLKMKNLKYLKKMIKIKKNQKNLRTKENNMKKFLNVKMKKRLIVNNKKPNKEKENWPSNNNKQRPS